VFAGAWRLGLAKEAAIKLLRLKINVNVPLKNFQPIGPVNFQTYCLLSGK
jgi:hypothetical protein